MIQVRGKEERMIDSILTSIKKSLGIEEAHEGFDHELVMHINTVIFELSQLGVGPQDEIFHIEDSRELWKDYLGDAKGLESVKSYIYLKVRLLFDPPTSSFVLEAMDRQITQLEWRLTLHAEGGTNHVQ